MKTIGIEYVKMYHTKLIERTGGTDGIKDIGLGLASSVIDEKDLECWIVDHKV